MKPLRPNAKRCLTFVRVATLVGAVSLLSACGLWDTTRSLWSSNPPPAPAPMPEPPWVPSPMPPIVVPMPEPMPIEPMADLSPRALPSDTAPSWATPEPLAPVITTPTRATPKPNPAATALATGRFAVQVGVFLVESNAQAIRTRTLAKLAADQTLNDSDKVVHVVRKGERTHVVVGDVADRNSAEFLAARLRVLLGQDVVVFQR